MLDDQRCFRNDLYTKAVYVGSFYNSMTRVALPRKSRSLILFRFSVSFSLTSYAVQGHSCFILLFPISPPYTFFLLNGDMELHRDR